MGRPRKGKIEGLSPGGRPVRITERLENPYYPLKSKPRGKAAKVWELTTFLKERVPLVYAYIVNEKEKMVAERNQQLQRIVEQLKQSVGQRKTRSRRRLTAYVIERAMEGAWEKWGLKPPYSAGNHDAFFRRYVHGHRGAIRDFRTALREPQPWHQHHVGHGLKSFFGAPGEAARHYGLMVPTPCQIAVLRIVEEE